MIQCLTQIFYNWNAKVAYVILKWLFSALLSRITEKHHNQHGTGNGHGLSDFSFFSNALGQWNPTFSLHLEYKKNGADVSECRNLFSCSPLPFHLLRFTPHSCTTSGMQPTFQPHISSIPTRKSQQSYARAYTWVEQVLDERNTS